MGKFEFVRNGADVEWPYYTPVCKYPIHTLEFSPCHLDPVFVIPFFAMLPLSPQ